MQTKKQLAARLDRILKRLIVELRARIDAPTHCLGVPKSALRAMYRDIQTATTEHRWRDAVMIAHDLSEILNKQNPVDSKTLREALLCAAAYRQLRTQQ